MRNKADIKRAKTDFAIRDYLNEKDKKDKESKERALKEEREKLFSSAYTTEGAYLYKQKQRKKLLEHRAEYAEHFTKIALTEALKYVVENALLLNLDEYKQLNENYQTEIESIVRSFLENSDINENYDNKAILSLFESIQDEMPEADLYLTEDEEKDFVFKKITSNAKIKNGLDELSRDVRTRVANIVSKDQEALAKEANDLMYIDDKELEKAPMVPNIPETKPNPVLADPEAAPATPEENPIDQTTPAVQESIRFVKKNYKAGILETLALNESRKMLSEGKELNNTLALSNAIKLITIFEALDASHVVKFGTENYNRIISASGRDMNPVAKTDLPGSEISSAPVGVQQTEVIDIPKVESPVQLNATKAEKKITKEIDSLPAIKDIKDSSYDDILVTHKEEKFKPFIEWEKEHPTNTDQVDIDTYEKYTDHTGKVYTEEQLRTFFENEGFDLDYNDIDLLASSYNFTKHK